jgi:hypothetical protein
MPTATNESDMLMHMTAKTHLSPESRSALSTVVVTAARHTAEKTDREIQMGKRFADMSVLRSNSTRVVAMMNEDILCRLKMCIAIAVYLWVYNQEQGV